MGFGEELPNSVCGDGERDSRRHLQGIYTDYLSVLVKQSDMAIEYGLSKSMILWQWKAN